MRLKLTVITTAVAALVLAAGLMPAGAATSPEGVKVYGNSFPSQTRMKELVRVRKSVNPRCTRAFKSSGKMKITVGKGSPKTKECAYDPLVIGGPDKNDGGATKVDNLEIQSFGKVAKGTPSAKRSRAFMAVSIRDGDDADLGWYLAVFPANSAENGWELWRRKPSAACQIVAAGDGPENGIGVDNELVLRLFDGDFEAQVNNTPVGGGVIDDFNVDPERTAVSLGVSSGTPRTVGSQHACPNATAGGGNGVTGSFEVVRVNVPDPNSPTASVQELGKTASAPGPSCPGAPCEAVGRLTGFQKTIGGVASPFTFDGPIQSQLIAWRLTLADPNSTQMNFFNNFFGGGPSAAVGLLRKEEAYTNRFTMKADPNGRFGKLDIRSSFLGHRITVAPGFPLTINPGNRPALILPTWAPAFAIGLGSANKWKATREAGFSPPTSTDPGPKPKCSPGTNGDNFKNGVAHATPDTTARYRCEYDTARLLYTALVARP